MRAILTTSQPPELIDAVKRQAKAEGLNLSEYVGKVLRDAVGKPNRKLDQAIKKQVRYKPRSAK